MTAIGVAGAKAQPQTDWDAIIKALEKWRADQLDDPSVTAIAIENERDPWAVLASTILSLRTKDAVTLVASRRLLSRAPTPQDLLALDEEAIAKLAYPVGFYKTKAHSLRAIAKILVANYDGKVPPIKEALLELPGVGLKTANLVLSEAFGQDEICVDVHVHRISNRAGWIATKTADESEQALREVLPKRYWKTINALLVLYGQRICAPVSPRCSRCIILAHCSRIGVTKTR